MSHARPSSGSSTPQEELGSAPSTGESALVQTNAFSVLSVLPSPRHLFEYLTRSQHMHFGYFEGLGDTLAQAQDRLILRSARLLGRGSLVLDVGCGLGGAVRLLAAQGHRVFGVDPCERSIAYARARTSSERARFLEIDLAGFAARARGARFDAVFLTEVLPQFTDLSALFAHCRALLRPGGLVLVHDVVREPSVPAGPNRFHARGAMRAAADAAGFDLIETRDASNRTSQTLSRLARALGERRAEIVGFFRASRPDIEGELERFEAYLRGVELAFSRQELVYETCAMRCSMRFGTDSVVVRARPRPVPVRESVERSE